MTILEVLGVWGAVILMILMTVLVVAIVGLLIESFKKDKEWLYDTHRKINKLVLQDMP